MALVITQGLPIKRPKKLQNVHGWGSFAHGDKFLVIRLTHHRILVFLARSILLALFIVSFPWLGSFIEASMRSLLALSRATRDPMNLEILPSVFQDLKREGLLKADNKAVFTTNDIGQEMSSYDFLSPNEFNVISISDLEQQDSVQKESIDFILTRDFQSSATFIDEKLKPDGIVTIEFNDDPAAMIKKPTNYKVVYLRRFGCLSFIALRKLNVDNISGSQRRLFAYASEAKKVAALKKLEKVLLEPPGAASGKSAAYLKKTKYLPDLMGDTLESYPRRLFIDVGLPEKDGGSGTGWFAKHYPTRNLHFDIYKIETVTEESSGKEVAPMEISDWLRKNVEDEEYVVMKAEAEVVEEMMKSKAIRLVDELFLECKPQGMAGGKPNRSRRAYWECLALYGRLRDEGVAVHQWWG